MKNENNDPTCDRESAGRERNQHQPAENAKLIQQFTAIHSVNDTWMDRAFIDFASMRVRNPSARDD